MPGPEVALQQAEGQGPAWQLLVVLSTTLLLLTSVEQIIIVVIMVPGVILSLLVAETATTLVPSEVTPVVMVLSSHLVVQE